MLSPMGRNAFFYCQQFNLPTDDVTLECCWYCKTLSEWSDCWIYNSGCSFVRTLMYSRQELQYWIWGQCYYWLYWQYLSTV